LKYRYIHIENLGFRPDGTTVLENVSFFIERGEFLSILGPNGAGKSSLIKHINRILPIREGAVRLRGKPIDTVSFRALARLVAYVPQAKGYVPPYCVKDFLMMSRYPFLTPFGRSGVNDEELVQNILRKLGLSSFEDRYLDTLSGGERQKIYIAAAMVQETEAVILDEPTTFLDPLHGQEIFKLLKILNQTEGKTIVVVTHDVNAAIQLSHRIIGMKNGIILFNGSPRELVEGNVLETLFDVPFHRFDSTTPSGEHSVYLPREARE